MGRSAESRSVAPCICPDRPIPASAAKGRRLRLRICWTASSVAFHQSRGFCSDQPLRGRDTLNAEDALSTSFCPSSIRTALTDDVPTSMPRKVLMRWARRRLGRPFPYGSCSLGLSGLTEQQSSRAQLPEIRCSHGEPRPCNQPSARRRPCSKMPEKCGPFGLSGRPAAAPFASSLSCHIRSAITHRNHPRDHALWKPATARADPTIAEVSWCWQDCSNGWRNGVRLSCARNRPSPPPRSWGSSSTTRSLSGRFCSPARCLPLRRR